MWMEIYTFWSHVGSRKARTEELSYLPCSASCEPSSCNLRLWAPQSSSRASRRFLVTCSQSTSSSRFGPPSSAFSVSVTKYCTIDFETFSPAFLFQPNEAILSGKGRQGCYLRDVKDPIQLSIDSQRVKINCMLTSRLANRACFTRYAVIDSSSFSHTNTLEYSVTFGFVKCSHSEMKRNTFLKHSV